MDEFDCKLVTEIDKKSINFHFEIAAMKFLIQKLLQYTSKVDRLNLGPLYFNDFTNT